MQYPGVEAKMVSKVVGATDEPLIIGAPLLKFWGWRRDRSPTVITGDDIVTIHHLLNFTKDSYNKHINDYIKLIKERLKEMQPYRVTLLQA